jgi:hypothetical protein
MTMTTLDIGGDTSLAMGGRGVQVMLRALTGFTLDASEARTAWPKILEHKWLLSEQLGRDVGLRVAATDFLENIERTLDGRTN